MSVLVSTNHHGPHGTVRQAVQGTAAWTVVEVMTERGKRSRQKIVATAATMIHDRGVRATTVDQVLAASGAGKSQFYHYFASKDALLREVLTYQFNQLVRAQGHLLQHLDTWPGIEAWFTFIVGWQRRRQLIGGCPIGSMAAELADSDRELRQLLAERFDEWESFLERGLRAMRTRGELSAAADPGALAEATLAAIQGGILLARTKKDLQPLRNALMGAMACLRSYRRASTEQRTRRRMGGRT